MADKTLPELGERTSRQQEIRSAEPVHEEYPEYYDSDSLLDTTMIPARDGYEQRWVRTHLKGVDDTSNAFRKYNKGWRPRPLDSVPKGQFIPQVEFNGANFIGHKGMILMERPSKLGERAREKQRAEVGMQMAAVRNDMLKIHDKGAKGMTGPDFTQFDPSFSTNTRKALIDDD